MANWKDNAVCDLKELRFLKESLGLIPLEILEIDAKMKRIGSSAFREGGRRNGGKGDDMIAACLDKKGRLIENLTRAKSKVLRIERAISVLDERERKVLSRFYIDKEEGHVSRLCEELGYEERNIYKIKDEAIRKFTLAMFAAVEN